MRDVWKFRDERMGLVVSARQGAEGGATGGTGKRATTPVGEGAGSQHGGPVSPMGLGRSPTNGLGL